jgi:hypothetical protein
MFQIKALVLKYTESIPVFLNLFGTAAPLTTFLVPRTPLFYNHSRTANPFPKLLYILI